MACSRLKNPAFTSAPVRLLVVLALLLTQTPLLPAMILGAATLDGGHRVECGSDVHGMKLRLAHCRTAASHSFDWGSLDEHSCLLRLFVREPPGESDHQLSFTSPSDAVQDSAEAFESIKPGDELPEFLLPFGSTPRLPTAMTPRFSDPWPAFHQTGPPALDRLRTVVMRA